MKKLLLIFAVLLSIWIFNCDNISLAIDPPSESQIILTIQARSSGGSPVSAFAWYRLTREGVEDPLKTLGYNAGGTWTPQDVTYNYPSNPDYYEQFKSWVARPGDQFSSYLVTDVSESTTHTHSF